MTRRAWGEGSIYSRTMRDGRTRWYASIEVDDGTGRRKRRTASTYDKAKVRALLRDLKGESTRSDLGTATLAEYLPTWLHSVSAKLRPVTVDGYAVIIERHILPSLGSVRLDVERLPQLALAQVVAALVEQHARAVEVDIHDSFR